MGLGERVRGDRARSLPLSDLGLRTLALGAVYALYPAAIWGGARFAARFEASPATSVRTARLLEPVLSLALTAVCVLDLAKDLVLVTAAA